MLSQLWRYALAGFAACIVHLSVLVALVELAGMAKTLSTVCGFCAAVPVNYALQHRFVFAPRGRDHRRYFSRYLVVMLMAAVLNAAVFALLLGVPGLPYPVAAMLSTSLVFFVNFAANRSFTFRPEV